MNTIKKIIICVLCVAVIAGGVTALTTPDLFIRYEEDTAFTYIEEDGGLILTQYEGECENLIIPSEIDSKPVKGIRGAFCSNDTLKHVRVSDGIEVIDYMAFYGCTSLVKAELPSSVRTIGHAAFLGCIMLSGIDIGDGVEEIMPFAFSDCYTLRKIELPDGLSFIGENAFSRCNSLAKLVIPASVEIIGGVTQEKDGSEPADQRGSIERSSFDSCDRLTLKVNEENKWYCITDGVLCSKVK